MFETEIAAGVAFLDKEVPGWLEKTNLDTLDLNATCQCILGQNFEKIAEKYECSGYTYIVRNMKLGPRWAIQHGFNLHWCDSSDFNFDILTEEWRTTILRLREERKVSRPVEEKGIVDSKPLYVAC